MQLQEVLEKRRSVRNYLQKPVEKEKVKEILQAAILAPSWNNTQVSRYYVVSKEETLQAVKAALVESNQHNVSGAPMLIVTTIITNKSGFNADGTAINELGNGWGYYDCGLHNANLLLKATELGLSTLIMGLRNAETIKKVLDIPQNENVVSVIGIGYSEAASTMPKRKTIEEITRFYED